MQWKIKKSDYNSKKGYSYVIISTPLGDFKGEAFLNKEDIQYESTYFGCTLAEERALVKYWKVQLTNAKIALRTLKNLEKVFVSLKDFNSKSREFCQLRKQIHIKEKEIEKLLYELDIMKTELKNLPTARFKYIQDVEKRKKKEQE